MHCSTRHHWLLSLLLIISSSILSGQRVTIVESTKEWTYQEGNANIPVDWNTLGFDESAWLVGNGGIGYGDGDDSTVVPDVQSVYMRQQFTIDNLSEITDLSLYGSFDDGFVAYLNGFEIARFNLSGMPPAFDSSTEIFKEAELD